MEHSQKECSDNWQLFLPIDSDDSFDFTKMQMTKFTYNDIKAMIINEI